VATPTGFADLRQAILADRFRGESVRFTAQVRTADLDNEGGIYLRVVDPERTRRPEDREKTTLTGSNDWQTIATAIDVPADAVFVHFGLTLTGPGRIWMTNPQLTTT
jgi:hypothetical protein